MSEFSDQYFHDLAPRQRRYDTPVSDQLHFCVFPNGVKSWVFLYEVDGHLRRRTIGLFPDMDYKHALRALDPNRRITEVDASEHRRPEGRPPMSMTLTLPPAVQRFLRRISLTDVLTAGGTAVVALAVLMFIGGSDEPPAPQPTPAPVAKSEPPPAEISPTQTPPPESSEPATEPAAALPEPAAAEPAGPEPEPADPARGTIQMAAPAPAETAPDPFANGFEEDAAASTEIDSPADDPTATDFEAEIATIGPVEELEFEELEERGTTGTAAAVWAAEAAAQEQLREAEDEATDTGAAEPLSDDGTAFVAGPDDGETTADTPPADPPAARESGDVTVRRALLAGDVIDGEPRDTLSGTVTVPADGELLIYFYLEFAGDIGEAVTHRWLNGGGVEEESAMQVETGGGSRVYTARLIGADRAGEWRVEAVTADGRLLRGLDFTVVAANEETPAESVADEAPAEPDS